jgi:hypothetical protein
MNRCKNIFLSLACLLAISVKTEAQGACTKCPTLRNTTLVCLGSICSKSIDTNCSWVADNPLTKSFLSGTPTITSSPLPGSSVGTGCNYRIKEDPKKIMIFTPKK